MLSHATKNQLQIANDKFSSSERTNKDEFMVIMVLFQLKQTSPHLYSQTRKKYNKKLATYC